MNNNKNRKRTLIAGLILAVASIGTAHAFPMGMHALKDVQPTSDTIAPRASKGVFGSVAIPVSRLPALDMFKAAWSEIQNPENINVRRIGYTAGTSLRDRLIAVNVEVNRSITYEADDTLYKSKDHWAAPSQTLARGKGDCEDFAILKMAQFVKEGIPLSDMALVTVYDKRRDIHHAVLDVAIGNRHYILDSLHDRVLTDSQLPEYMPLYSIVNGRGYLHGIPKGV